MGVFTGPTHTSWTAVPPTVTAFCILHFGILQDTAACTVYSNVHCPPLRQHQGNSKVANAAASSTCGFCKQRHVACGHYGSRARQRPHRLVSQRVILVAGLESQANVPMMRPDLQSSIADSYMTGRAACCTCIARLLCCQSSRKHRRWAYANKQTILLSFSKFATTAQLA